MGIDFVLRVAFKITLFTVYMASIQYFITLFTGYLKNVALPNSTIAQVAHWFGVLDALAVFINIIIIAFAVKSVIGYWKTM